jgi:hypothetical protein
MADRFGSDRIEHHVTAHLQKMAVFLNENPFKPPLKDMANTVVALVKGLGINTVKAASFPSTSFHRVFQ